VWECVVTWVGKEIHRGFWCRNPTERNHLAR